MQIVILRDLNPAKGLVAGAIRDWPRPVITEMERQLGGKDWYSFDMGLIRSVGRTQAREQLRPADPDRESQEASQEPAVEAGTIEPASTAEAILAEAPKAHRGPGRPRKAELQEA